MLHRFGYTKPDDPVFIQSFEVSNLERLATRTRLRLIQLVDDSGMPYDRVAANERGDYRSMIKPDGLRKISGYAAGIAVAKQLIQPVDSSGSLSEPTNLVRAAHDAGLLLHVWTLRADSTFLPKAYRGDLGAEVRRFRDLGVDGMFTDFPDLATAALRR
jgi:glycerophosphoryl diester phosphodiesterase